MRDWLIILGMSAFVLLWMTGPLVLSFVSVMRGDFGAAMFLLFAQLIMWSAGGGK